MEGLIFGILLYSIYKKHSKVFGGTGFNFEEKQSHQLQYF